MEIKTTKIGYLKLKNPLILAPMVDVTDSAFRQITKSQGVALVFTPMLYTSQILNKNKKTLDLLKFKPKERPIGIQITGDKLHEYKKLIPILKKFDIIDINCGCPSHKLINSKAGSYLLKSPETISKIIKLLKSNLPNKTITVKIRLGYNKNNLEKIAKTIEEAKADAITLHPRLSTQSNSTPAQWSQIKKLKELVKIPVIGNGDIFSPEDVKKMLEQTNCDAVMIARGAIGNPSIFKQSLKYLKTNSLTKESKEKIQKQNLKLFLKYLQISKKQNTFDLGRVKHIGNNFIKNFKNSSSARAEFSKLKDQTEISKFIKQLMKKI